MKEKETAELYNELCLSYMKKYKEPEVWRRVVIDNCETKYIVSNYGRIYNDNNLKLPPIAYSNKHYYVDIKACGRYMRKPIYRLVALTFIPVPQKYFDAGYTLDNLVVDHKRDGDPDNFNDNTIWNLQWLTYRENTSKAAKCGYRDMYPIDFREKLDKMILDGCGNEEIYAMCLNDYGYSKEEVKANLQVRRRRLGCTLKEHHENDKSFTAEIDRLLLKGMSNDEIIEELGMSKEGRASRRLLQYRRSLLKIPANVSKYFTNEQSIEVYDLFKKDMSIKEIIAYFGFDKLPLEDQEKIAATLRSRRHQWRAKQKKE